MSVHRMLAMTQPQPLRVKRGEEFAWGELSVDVKHKHVVRLMHGPAFDFSGFSRAF